MKYIQTILFLLSLSLLVPTSYSKDWSFQLEPYLMATSINGDASVGRINGVEVDLNFGNILKRLDSAGMLHFEALNKSGWGLMLDYGFMDLSQKAHSKREGIIKARVRQSVFDALVFYRSNIQQGSVDYYAGIRTWDNKLDLNLDPTFYPGSLTQDIHEDWIDIVVGIRWLHELNQRWKMQFIGDIGGMGIESKFTSNIDLGLQYKMTNLLTLDIKYKATWVNYESGKSGQVDYFQYDTVTHGPIIGLIFNF